jgi:hypothetical protein
MAEPDCGYLYPVEVTRRPFSIEPPVSLFAGTRIVPIFLAVTIAPAWRGVCGAFLQRGLNNVLCLKGYKGPEAGDRVPVSVQSQSLQLRPAE